MTNKGTEMCNLSRGEIAGKSVSTFFVGMNGRTKSLQTRRALSSKGLGGNPCRARIDNSFGEQNLNRLEIRGRRRK